MKFLLRSASLLALFCISSLKPIHAQVLNGQSTFRAVTAQWRSDCDGDGYGFQFPFSELTDRADEENVCHIWTEIDGQMVQPKYCHVWSAKNWDPSSQHKSERNFTNITIGAKENVSAGHFFAKADYWENDIGDMCTFDQVQVGPVTVDSDDRHTLNKTFHHIIPISGSSTPFILGNVMVYDFRNRPQSQWFEYPESAIELDNSPGAPPTERVYVKIKTIWNFTHGNDMDDPLDFGTIRAGRTYADHVNSLYAHDVPEELAYKDSYFGDGLRDVAYVFALQDEADVTISIDHLETVYALTYRVFNEQRQQVASSHDGGYSRSKTLSGLCAGRYYVVVDDISPNTFTSNPADRGFKLSVSAANFNPKIATSTDYWTVYTYDEVNLEHPSKYRGSYTVQPLEVDTDDFFLPGGDYSHIPGFVANECGPGTTSRNYFTQVFRRQFDCGHYALKLNFLDDYVKVYVDGALVYENFNYGSGQGIVWQGEIKERMEIYHAELTGGERIHFEVLPGYGADWRVHFYRKSSGLYFGDGKLVDKYGFLTVGMRDFLLSGAPTTIDDVYFDGHLVLREACAALGNTVEDFFTEFTQTGFTPGVYELAVRNNLIGTACNNCNFNLLVDGQSVYTAQDFTPYKVYLDGRTKASLFSDIGGVPWSTWQFTSVFGPLMSSRGIRVVAQDVENHLGIAQDKSSVLPCEAVTLSVEKLNGLGHIGSTVQWQRSTDGTVWNDISGANGLSYTDPALNTQTQFRYVLKDRDGVVGYTSDTVTVEVVPDPSFTGGQAMGAQIVEPCQAPAVLTVVGSSNMASFQWQSSTDGLNFSDINGASSADYLPPSLSQTTHFRRQGTNACGVSTASSPVIVTLKSDIGYGTGEEWAIGVWGKPNSSLSPLVYAGSATQAPLSIDLPNAMGGTSNPPSDLPGYQGCPVNSSSYQTLFRRTGWPCGRYDFHLISVLGNLNSSIVARFDFDGDGTFDRQESYSSAPFTTVERHYYVDLRPESRVELFYTKVAPSDQGGFLMNISLDEAATLAVNCQDITVYLDDAGEAVLSPADLLTSSSNTCEAPSLEVSPAAFNCQGIGPQTVTLTAMGGDEISAQCMATVMVADTTRPAALCRPATVYLDAQGQGSLATADVNNGSTDNCGISSIDLSQTAFDCSHLGEQLVTLSVSDASDNLATCEQLVMVVDTGKPVISTTATSGDLGCNPTVEAPTFTGTDNCEGNFAPLVSSDGPSQNGCAYAQTWTASYTDASGNAAESISITYTWTVDTEKPVLATTAISGDLGCNPTVEAPLFTGTDNCEGDISPNVATDGPTQDGCAYSQTWTASYTDACGNTADPISITYTWTVDTEKPILATTAMSGDLGCNPTVEAPLFTGTDNCEGDIHPNVATDGPAQDGCAYSQTWTASYTDACGNTADPISITYTWTVDAEKPVLVTTATSGDLGCNPTVEAPLFTGTDNCEGDISPNVATDGPTQDGCAYSQTWTASYTDACGNTAEPISITYTWTVDAEKPILATTAISGDLGCNPTVEAPLFMGTDNCEGDISPNVATDGPAQDGCAYSQTWTASYTDACGNAAEPISMTYTWTVDAEKPILATIAMSGDLGCNPTVEAPLFTGTDNCEGDISPDVATDGPAQDGCAYSQTWTASYTDACGNTADPISITYTWTVDAEKPVLATTATSGDLGCNPTVEAPLFTGTDNCEGDIHPNVATDGPAQDGCAYSQTWTASYTDACGNTADPISITYTWKEAAPLILSCPANEVIAACQSQDTVDAAFDLWLAAATVSGGCDVILSNDAAAAPPAIGGSVTVTFTAASACEADVVCTRTFTVAPCFTVSGNIVWEHDRIANPLGVPGVAVALTGDDTGSDSTDGSGNYAIPTAGGNSLTLTPTKTGDPYEGVDAADVARIQQHVTYVAPLGDGYKAIAADVNQSNSVTGLDAAVVFHALNGNPSAQAIFETPSWRFVDAAHGFTDESSPWLFPDTLALMNVMMDVPGQDFVGIKMGDVNGTWAAPLPLLAPVLNWAIPDVALKAGQTLRIPFRANGMTDVAAWQFALRFDTDYLRFERALPTAAFPLKEENFGAWQADRGELRSVFAVPQGLALPKDEVIFELEFQVVYDGLRLNDVLRLDNDILDGRVYDTALNGGAVALAFEAVETRRIASLLPGEAALGFALEQNIPNPFSNETLIRFELPEAGEAVFSVHDMMGRLVYEQRGFLDGGQHEVRLDAARLGATGVLSYTLWFRDAMNRVSMGTRRMVLVR